MKVWHRSSFRTASRVPSRIGSSETPEIPTGAAPVTDAVYEPREILAGVSLAGPVADRAPRPGAGRLSDRPWVRRL